MKNWLLLTLIVSDLQLATECRVKFLADILIKRGYDVGLLQKQFCRAVDKYIIEFQKWTILLDLKAWFFDIVRSS